MNGRFLCLLLAGLWFTATAMAADIPPENLDYPKKRLPAPDFSLRDLNGQTLRLSDYRGKVVLLNFWATFCSPCRREMPALEALWHDYRGQGLIVLAVAADRGDPDQVRRFIEAGGYSFPVVLDADGTVRRAYEVVALPMTYIIGRDGRFHARALGERRWEGSILRARIEALLANE